MKRILILLALCATFGLASGQTAAPAKPPGAFDPQASLPVTGTINILYRTRGGGDKVKTGTSDLYTLSINVANSALFRGTLAHQPYVSNTLGSNQQGRLTADIELAVLNPANPAQSRDVGKMFGFVPIDKQNVYDFGAGGGIKVAVFPIGAAKGFESRFNGIARAKPPASSGFAKIQQDAVRLVSSKGGAIVLTKYDKMTFENHVLPAGPVQIYPEVTVSGTMFYDYGRSAWHFNNVTFIYNAEGKRASDVLTGSIRWIEAKNRRQTGDGHYEVDIRVNEPPPTESAVFGSVADESAFFTTDATMPGLTGAITYKDTFVGEDTVTASAIKVDLTATKLSKVQAMMLAKLLFLSSVVPVNAE